MISGAKQRLLSIAAILHLKIFGHEMSEDMRKFLGHLSWSFFGLMLYSVTMFILNITAGRIIGPVEYGKYNMVVAAANVLVCVMLLGFDNASIKIISSESNHRRQFSFLSTLSTIVFLSCLIIGTILLIEVKKIGHFFSIGPEIITLAIFLAFILSFKSLLGAFVRSFKFFRFEAVIKIIEAISAIAFFVIVIKFNKTFHLYYYALLFSGVIAISFYFSKVIKLFGKISREFLAPIWHYQKINVGVLFAMTITITIDKLMLGRYAGDYQLGIYSAYITATNSIFAQLALIFNNVFLPYISNFTDKKFALKKIERLLKIFVLPIFVAIFAIAFVIMEIFGSKYPINFYYLLAFATLTIVNFIAIIYYSIVASSEKILQSYSIYNYFQLFMILAAYAYLIAGNRVNLVSVLAITTVANVFDVLNSRFCILSSMKYAKNENVKTQ